MLQDDSYYLSLGYEYARQRKELDILEEERQALLAQAVRVKIETEKADKVLEEANRVSEQRKKIVRASKQLTIGISMSMTMIMIGLNLQVKVNTYGQSMRFHLRFST